MAFIRGATIAQIGLHPILGPGFASHFPIKETDPKFGPVELVQLIEEEHRRRAGKRESPFAGQLFRDMQWSKERLCTKLNGIIQTKGDKYKRAARSMDVLIIHTAETWLSSGQASEWLAECEIRSHPNIASVFLLFEYEPGRGASHWPVFWLNGEIGGRSAAH